MAAVPIIISGVMMPKAKGGDDTPVPAVFIGYASIAGLTVGGGPVIPDNTTPPDPPIDVPPGGPGSGANIAVVIKPAPATGGWGLASQAGDFQWFFVPGGAQPKR